ncbi:MAG TPA: iron ABC transporter permease [Candidatus Limnocylindrales bacterium]|nr:iron ABC transporter permease [Candidatus Limnocylindrales bacterium]
MSVRSAPEVGLPDVGLPEVGLPDVGAPAAAAGHPPLARSVARLASARRPLLVALGGLVALLVVLLLGLALGSVAIPLPDTVAILAHRLLGWPVVQTWPSTYETILFDLRLPRMLLAMCVGLGLSVAGATFQGVLRNPLADPYVLGTASGAALGAAIGLLVPVPVLLVGLGLAQLAAFVGALLAVGLVWRLARAAALDSLSSVLLTGYAVGALLAAGLAVAMVVSGTQLRQIVAYLLGSFATASWSQLVVAAPLILIGSALLTFRSRSLDAFLLGEETAAHLGLDVGRERLLLLGLASLITAAAVASAGLIGFVGLVVPHVVRLLVGPGARAVVPLSGLVGATFLAACDLLARMPGELPVGIVTAIVGAPFFLALLRSARAGYEL